MDDIRKGTCPLCRHNKIIRSQPHDARDQITPVPLALAREIGWPGVEMPSRPFGALNTYACQRCGFVQWFALDPEKVPIDAKYGTMLLSGPETAGPYR